MRYVLLLLAAAAGTIAWLVVAGRVIVPDVVERIWPEIVIGSVMLVGSVVAFSVAAARRDVARRVDRLTSEWRAQIGEMHWAGSGPLQPTPPAVDLPVVAPQQYPEPLPSPVIMGPRCFACGGPVVASTDKAKDGCAHATVALLMFAGGVVAFVLVPLFGWVLGPVICIGALCILLGGPKRRNVFRCTRCAAVIPR